MTAVLGIDPGTTRSAFVVLDGERIVGTAIVDNEVLVADLRTTHVAMAVIERVEPRYGLRLGWETVQTIEWVGRFHEALDHCGVTLLPRSAILRHLGIAPKGNADSGVRMAMLDRWGGEAAGRKGGPLYGIRTHAWQALAAAVAYREGLR